MIAPSDNYNRIVKVLQQYKIDPIVKSTWNSIEYWYDHELSFFNEDGWNLLHI